MTQKEQELRVFAVELEAREVKRVSLLVAANVAAEAVDLAGDYARAHVLDWEMIDDNLSALAPEDVTGRDLATYDDITNPGVIGERA